MKKPIPVDSSGFGSDATHWLNESVRVHSNDTSFRVEAWKHKSFPQATVNYQGRAGSFSFVEQLSPTQARELAQALLDSANLVEAWNSHP